MKIYTLPDGQKLRAEDQFQIDDQKYPGGWLRTASEKEIELVGIKVSIELDPVIPDRPIETVSPLEFRMLFTDEERLGITEAAMQSAQIRMFMDDLSAANTVSLSADAVVSGINAVVEAGLITRERGDEILVGSPAPIATGEKK